LARVPVLVAVSRPAGPVGAAAEQAMAQVPALVAVSPLAEPVGAEQSAQWLPLLGRAAPTSPLPARPPQQDPP
jgi:hypothetical protein